MQKDHWHHHGFTWARFFVLARVLEEASTYKRRHLNPTKLKAIRDEFNNIYEHWYKRNVKREYLKDKWGIDNMKKNMI